MAASSPQMTILEPSSKGDREWLISTKPFNPISLADLPKKCYVFLDVVNYPPADGRRERLLAHFNVPEFVANRTCFELNGYFGSKADYEDKKDGVKHVTSYTTWFRCLVKMVRKTDDSHDGGPEYATGKKDYKWFEMSYFTRWDNKDTCQVLCVDTPSDFPAELRKLLQKQTKPLDFRDPFAMHSALVDQMIVYYDVSVWRVRDPVRDIEKSRMRIGSSFGIMHEISRHAIHTAEILQVAADTLKDMQRCRAAVYDRLLNDPGETYKEQAKDYAQFQISLLKNLKLRSDSNQERLQNEVNLAFNNLARQDNSVMKSIALLTMIFLPPTFISALFSTTFYNYGDDGNWEVSSQQWIYWATAVPATIIVVILWSIWLAHNDTIVGFCGEYWKGAKSWWKRRTSPKQKKIAQA